jgi:hypothetical protein
MRIADCGMRIADCGMGNRGLSREHAAQIDTKIVYLGILAHFSSL